MISLASTWNPKKREPFAWEGYQTNFVPYPETKHAENVILENPENWLKTWGQKLTDENFKKAISQFEGINELLDLEIDSLRSVREFIAKEDVFAVITEAMQCEGGDRYSSSRFHNALINLCRTYNVALIYDEVQTGFALGGEFFWHRIFKLQDSSGSQLDPDYITCAKKAQTGIVLSKDPIDYKEQFSSASMIRGYIQANMMDQYSEKIAELESYAKTKLVELVENNSQLICSPRSKGLAFAFDFKDEESLNDLINKRFDYGLLYYQAGTKTARFRLNLSYEEAEIEYLFDSLQSILGESPNSPSTKSLSQRTSDSSYKAQLALLKLKLNKSNLEQTLSQFQLKPEYQLVHLNEKSYIKYREKIIALEELVYEPSRITPIEKFDRLIKTEGSIALCIEKDGQTIAMGFLGQTKLFPGERGTTNDSSFENSKSLYTLALTVSPSEQRNGLGRFLKYALTATAISNEADYICGRQRDKYAKGMLSINFSLGAYELQHLFNDYPDNKEYRDAIYYRMPLRWSLEEPKPKQVESPLTPEDIDEDFIEKNLPALINKITISNFISESFANNLQRLIELLPKKLQHLYSTSGQSECVDKVVKSIWYNNKAGNTLVTFDGCHFGHGSFLSRTLSNKDQAFFEVERLEFPTEENSKKLINQLDTLLSFNQHLAVFIEPLTQVEQKRAPKNFLKDLKELCRQKNIPLVYNETAGQFYRFCSDNFFASNIEEIQPDAGFSFIGGQMGVVFCKEELFAENPLLLISTWDADEYSLACYVEAVKKLGN